MTKFLRSFFPIFLAVLALPSAPGLAESVEVIIGSQRYECTPAGPNNPAPVTCVRNCLARYSDGKCSSYGSDFCAPQAACASNCVARYSDGTCSQYTRDFCGSNAHCIPQCLARYSDGTCSRFGADVCN